MYNKHFWLVWNPSGSNPKNRHNNENDAFKEAERLARLNPSQQFFVLLAIGGAEKVDVHVTKFDDGIPF